MQTGSFRGIGRARLGQRILECVRRIGTLSADSIRASGHPMPHQQAGHAAPDYDASSQKVLARVPSTRDPKRTLTRDTIRIRLRPLANRRSMTRGETFMKKHKLLIAVIMFGLTWAGIVRAEDEPIEQHNNPTILLVHGAWADSSSWNGVVDLLL
jgi:hypothetical protein